MTTSAGWTSTYEEAIVHAKARPEAWICNADDRHALLKYVQALACDEMGDAVELLHCALTELILGQVVYAVGRMRREVSEPCRLSCSGQLARTHSSRRKEGSLAISVMNCKERLGSALGHACRRQGSAIATHGASSPAIQTRCRRRPSQQTMYSRAFCNPELTFSLLFHRCHAGRPSPGHWRQRGARPASMEGADAQLEISSAIMQRLGELPLVERAVLSLPPHGLDGRRHGSRAIDGLGRRLARLGHSGSGCTGWRGTKLEGVQLRSAMAMQQSDTAE